MRAIVSGERTVLEAASAHGQNHAEFKFDPEATTTTTPVMTFFKQSAACARISPTS
jgi:hypothetical protein